MTAAIFCPATHELPIQVFVPSGWPEMVGAPGTPGWEEDATRWLLESCPSEYREYPALTRHPTLLARFAADNVESELCELRKGLESDQPSLLDDEAEELRLLTVRKAIALVEEALRGKVFIRAVRN